MANILISPEYQQVLRDMHDRQRWGSKGWRYIQNFLPAFKALGCQSLIDYGSGRESVRRVFEVQYPDIKVYCYDPGIVGRESSPPPADYVICTDVLEHVEEQFVDSVLNHIQQLMLRGGYLLISMKHAKRLLPDGRNAHILVRNRAWWHGKFKSHKYKVVRETGNMKNLVVWVEK